jgi:hypothetical protein
VPRQPRDPALRPYRVAVYVAYGLVCTVLFFQLIRSVTGDLYGSRRAPPPGRESPTACLDDIHRLYNQLSARAVQPAPRGLESDQLAREWDAWSRRWESDVAQVTARCDFSSPDPAMQKLADALEGVEELRRRLTRSGEDAAEEARRVKEALESARALLKVK